MESTLTSSAPLAATYTPKILTGIDAIDRTWGGFYRGGSYLAYGRAASGRDLFTMRFTQVGVQMGESVLFLSPSRPKDLMIQAASIGFNLREAYGQGLVKLLRIPPVLNQRSSDDSGILKSMRDLVAIIRREKPQRLVLNDFMPFVMFRSFDRFRGAFVEMLEHTDVLDMTMVLVMSEPANKESHQMIDFMNSQMTGSVHILTPGEREDQQQKRRLVLMPNIGHLRRKSEEVWDLAPFVEEEQRLSSGPNLLRGSAAQAQAAPRGYRPIRLGQPRPAEQPEQSEAPAQSGGVRLGGMRPASPSMPPPANEIPQVPTVLGVEDEAPEPPRAPAPPISPPQPPTRQALRPQPPTHIPRPEPQRAPEPEQPAYTPPPVQPPSSQPSYAPEPPRTPEPQQPAYTPPPVYEAPAEPQPVPPAPEPQPAHSRTEAHYDRERFSQRLQQHFERRDAGGAPFLLVAMRMDPQGSPHSGPFDFDTISDLVASTLRPGDDLYIDADNERLVVFLDDTRDDQKQAFFARLKQRLSADVPRKADHLLHAVSAVTLPNGQPFGTADECLAYVLS
jgi:KaiC/GvpD/RAD55 family RecA-like ATPase